jgi:hypothetical protein
MKVTYWYAKCLNDSDAYSIREKTKKAAKKMRDEIHSGYPNSYAPIVKVTVEYKSGFDLIRMAAGEGGIGEEAAALNDWVAKNGDYATPWDCDY